MNAQPHLYFRLPATALIINLYITPPKYESGKGHQQIAVMHTELWLYKNPRIHYWFSWPSADSDRRRQLTCSVISDQYRISPTYPLGTETLAPSRIAWAIWKSRASAALVAARNASQISLRPSKAGAVSQNSSLFERNCPSVRGTSERHRMVSWQSGRFLRAAPKAMPAINGANSIQI